MFPLSGKFHDKSRVPCALLLFVLKLFNLNNLPSIILLFLALKLFYNVPLDYSFHMFYYFPKPICNVKDVTLTITFLQGIILVKRRCIMTLEEYRNECAW